MCFDSIFDSANLPSLGKRPQSKKRRPARRGPAARLQVQALESRNLLSFTPAVSYPVGSSPQAVVVGDFNGSGKADIVTANTNSNTISVLLNNGDGTFGAAQDYAVGAAPKSVAVGDFNGDGKLDVVAATYGASLSDGSVSVLLGNGDGTFQPAANFLVGVNPQWVAVGDFNHDGKLDLATANQGDYYSGGNSIGVLLGNGDGTFQAAQQVPVGNWPLSVAVGDMNHDGKLDLVETGFITSSYAAEAQVSVLLGNGDGTFASPNTTSAGSYYNVTSPVLGDFNGDGNLDVAVLDAGEVELLLGWGTGTLHPPSLITGPSYSFDGLAAGDFNHDCNLDLATNSTSSAGAALLGNGDGTFQSAVADNLGAGTAVAVGDFNGDQFPDLASAQSGNNAVSVSLNAADWSTITPQASSFAVSGLPSPMTAGTAESFSVTALNADGTVDTGYTGTVQFSSSDSHAALPAPYTFTANDAGSHTFSATLKTAGTQSITATDTVTGSMSGSASVMVSPAAASTVTVAGFPSPVTAGGSGNFTVTLRDAYGNVATGYTGTVHFTSSDPQAVLPANYTFTTADAGVHGFSATLKTAGTQSISVRDTVQTSVTGVESAITVNPAAASKFVIGTPASVSAGVPFSLTITVEDAYGNVVTGYVGTIHFTSSDKYALLPANYTFTAGDQGAHTFTGVVLKKKGYDSITATDTKNTAITGKAVVDVV